MSSAELLITQSVHAATSRCVEPQSRSASSMHDAGTGAADQHGTQ